jgi:AcrR family transcriptional regulator
MRPAAAPLNFEAEFDCVVSAFLPNRVYGNRHECTVDGETSGTEPIYRRVLEIIDAHGVAGLTFRKLADDLKMSTRTIRKRVGHRDRLIRAAVEQYASALTVDSALAGGWELAVQGWCSDLHGQLMGRPRITELMVDTDGELIDQQVRRIADYAVHEGIPFDVAYQCCKSLVRLTINDAVARSRGGAAGGEPSAHTGADAPLADTVRWVVAGVRVESAVGGPDGKT